MIISNPNRPLDKGVEMSKFDFFCSKIAPYVLLACILLLMAFILFVLVKYGAGITGTEANQYYNHLGDI